MAKDYYEILGINENATAEEIKKAYRDLAKRYHPDANQGDKNAESRFKDISEAYSVLGNPQKRSQYDQMRKLGAFGPGAGAGGFDFGGFDLGNLGKFWKSQGGRQAHTGGSGSIFEELFGSGSFGLGDILGDLFDRGSKVRREKYGAKQQGESLYATLTIPFEVAIKGGKQIINITKEEQCAVCHGTGAHPGSKPETCPTCNGLGTISMSHGLFSVNRPCPNCYGRGYIVKEACAVCHGTGEIKTTKRLAINIPPGIKENAQLRLKGQGKPGIKGGPAGDLYITVHIAPHKFFKRKGNDIYCEIPLDIVKAIKGTRIRVKTVYGKKIELVIPPGTRDGKTFRLKGMGVISNKGTGDQYITIRVNRRSNLTDEERKIVEEFENNGRVNFK